MAVAFHQSENSESLCGGAAFARPDYDRAMRQGAGEVIYGEGKTAEQIAAIASSLMGAGQPRVLATRVDAKKADAVGALWCDDGGIAPCAYNETARLVVFGGMPAPDGDGVVAIACAGTSDLPVAEEAAFTAEFLGNEVRRFYDVGVAGIHRLLDVADELPDAFIEKIRTAVKRVSPEKFLLGEVWEDATTKFGFDHRRTYLLGKGLDSVMNYPFKNSVLDFVKGKPAEQAANEILTICEHYPAPAMDTALNFLSTHDTERALTVIADEPANGRGRQWQSGRCVTGDAYEEGLLRLRMAYAIIYTLPGVPCLYYGDEIAMQGYRDPFNRAFFRWDAHEQRLRPVLAQLAQLRHTCEAFRTGKLWVLRAEGGILHYQRIGEVETAEIIVNRTEHIIVETLASGKSTEVNPMGFTIVVEEVGHNPNHSYYDYV